MGLPSRQGSLGTYQEAAHTSAFGRTQRSIQIRPRVTPSHSHSIKSGSHSALDNAQVHHGTYSAGGGFLFLLKHTLLFHFVIFYNNLRFMLIEL